MAYNSNKGKQHSGDIQYENDANDTQIDFEDDSITLRTGNQPRLEVNNGHVSASGPMSASAFFGDGSNLTGIGGGGSMSSFILSGSTGPTQTISDGNTLNISGGVGITTTAGATDKLTIDLDNTAVSVGSYTYTALTVDAQGRITAASNGSAPSVTTFNGYAENRVLTAGETEGEIDGEANLTFNGSLLQISGTVSASAAISASTYYGDGSNLTGIGGGGGISFNGSTANGLVTYGGATTADVESSLTFNGTMLQVSGTVSASAAISASTFYGDGSNLTGVGGGGSMSTFIVSGNAGAQQTINDGETLFVSGGAGITTAGVAGEQLTINLDNTDVSAGSYTYTALTVDAQGRITAASNGTSPAITTLSNEGANRIITSDGGGQATAELDLTFNGSLLQVSGTVSASAAISASSFFGDGSNLTGIGGGGISFNGSTANGLVTYGGASTADVEPNLTFNGSLLQVSGTVSASAAISASSFYGDGSSLTGVTGTISAVANGADNRVATFSSDTALNGEANLTFDGSTLSVPAVTSSVGILITGSAPNLAVGAANPSPSTVMFNVVPRNTDNKVLMLAQSQEASGNRTIFAVTGSGKVLIGGTNIDGVLNVSGSDAETLISAKADTVGTAFTLNSAGDGIFAGIVSASAAISASTFYGDGSNLTGIGGGGGGISWDGSTPNGIATYKDADEATVEPNLTFNGSLLQVSGTVSASAAISASTFYGDGSNLTGIAGGGIPDVVSDTSPQLGGNLDVNGNDIVSVSNGNIELDPNGSGKVVFKGNGTKGSGQFVLNCENNSHGIIIKGPPHSAAASYTLTLPNNDGDANQVLKTDGAGNTSWVDRVSFNGSTVDGLVTYANANTADVQANLTFNPGASKLGVTGQVSASLGITGSEVHTNNAVVAGHIFYPSVTSLGNNTGTGEIVRFGSGTTTAGKTYYLSTGGAWSEVNSAASGSSGLPLVAVAIGTSPTAQGMMIRGFFDFATYLTGAFSPGMPVYLTGSGGVTTIRPSNPGESLRVAGHCTTTANVIYFNPSPDYLSLT